MVQLDYVEELGPLRGMYGSTEAVFEVQRTIKSAELMAFLRFLKKGPIKVHVDNKGIKDELRRGERKCIDPKACDADLWIKIWDELHFPVLEEISVEVEHVTAHSTKKDKRDMSQFEKFVAEGNEKADELARRICIWWKRGQRQCSKREREKCVQLCSMHPVLTAWWRNGKIFKSSSRSQKKN